MTTAQLLQRGQLEQMCPACGRWEAAHPYCSNCFRPMTEADWYRNGDVAKRRRRFPPQAPTRETLPLRDRDDPSGLRDPVPVEYRQGKAHWPDTWGPWPYGQAPRSGLTPVQEPSEPGDALITLWAAPAALSASGASSDQ